LGFEIAVNDADGVRAGQRTADLSDDPDRVIDGHRAPRVDSMIERLALEQLHHDVRRAVAGLAVVVYLHHEARPQLRGCLGLEVEPLARLARARIPSGDELDGDALAEPEVHRGPDAPHPSPPDEPIDAVLASDDRSRKRRRKVLVFVPLGLVYHLET